MTSSENSTLSNKTSIDEETSISCQNITISYDGSEAVRNIFFDIPKGKITSLIGPSGLSLIHI